MEQSLIPSNPDDFEKFIALHFKKLGFQVIMPPQNNRGYDIELVKDDNCIAVQVKNHKAKCNIAQIQKFRDYISLPIASKFSAGWFISSSGFSLPALTLVESEIPTNLRLGTYLNNGNIDWNYPNQEHNTAEQDRDVKYFGVFTCKGGVGKTTTAAHLAGAFALMGYDVILLDLDPDKNLRKLFLQDHTDIDGDASLYVPPRVKGKAGAVITVLNHDQWDEKEYQDIKIVICDCSPVLSENPESLVEKFHYCIIPTTLNPLGIAKNGDVLTRTFKHIRDKNSHAIMFAFINSFESSKDCEQRNERILAHIKRIIDSY